MVNPQKKEEICPAGRDLISVSTKGDLYPCFMFIDEEKFKLMNINDPLFSREEIEKKTEIYRKYQKKMSNSCKDCFAINVCSGCMGHNYYSTGSAFQSPDSTCETTREILRKVLLHIES